ncbi:MAG: DUF2130 domain-containing protein [Patescibacteria group bacterium]|jgi:hypothetical protein
MSDSSKIVIVCPGCQKEISIDDALTHQIAEGERQKAKEEYRGQLEAEKKKMWVIALEKAAEKAKDDLDGERRKAKELEQELEIQKKKRAEAEETEIKLRQERVQFEDEQRAWKIEQQRQIDAERSKIKEEAARAVLDEHRMKDAEKDKKINDLMKSLEEARRKAEQGSQQTQGEVLELELEESLKAEFPIDEIAPVPKGINGADIIQHVHDQRGRACGSIAWELKQTKAWTEGWVQKLKDDQRKVKAEVSILISSVLPAGLVEAGFYNGIYVATPKMAVSIAHILRRQIIEVAGVLSLEEGKSEKKDVVFNYLLGPEFRGRIESFIESAIAMKSSLEREKRAYVKIWAEREKLIDRIETSMAGLYGDIKGIAGNSLPQIKSLELSDGEDELDQTDAAVTAEESDTIEEKVAQMVESAIEDDAGAISEGEAQQVLI